MKKKLDKLTPEQEAMIPICRDKWIEIGLRTGETDWDTFEKNIKLAYEKTSFPFPNKIVRVNSPIVGALAASIANRILNNINFITSNTKNSLITNVTNKSKDVIDNTVISIVRNAVVNKVEDAVGSEVINTVRNAVEDAVNNAVGSAVRSTVRNTVGRAVDNTVGSAVRNAIGRAVENVVVDTVGNTAGSAIEDVVVNKVEDAVGSEIINTVGRTVEDVVNSAVKDVVRNAVGRAVINTVGSAIEDAVGSEIINTVGNTAGSVIEDVVRNAVGRAVGNAVDNAVGNAVGSAVRNAVENVVGNAVGSAVRNAVRNAVENVVGKLLENKKLSWHYWLGGQFWVGGWYWGNSFSSFFIEYCGLKVSKDIREKFEIYKAINSSVNYIWCNKNFVMVCARPTKINRNLNNQLHSITEKSIEYPDGWGLYSFNGITISEKLFNQLCAKSYTFEQWSNETNEETKSLVLAFYEEKFGGEFVYRFLSKYLKEINTYVDKKKENYLEKTTGGMNVGVYTLFKGKVNNTSIAYVRCYCPSTDRMFFLGVHPDFNNAKDAISSLCQIPVKLKDNLLSIKRQGEIFSFNFDEYGTELLRDKKLTEEDYQNVISLKGDEYFEKIQWEY